MGDALLTVTDCSWKVIDNHVLCAHGLEYDAEKGSILFESLPCYLQAQPNVYAGGRHGAGFDHWCQTKRQRDYDRQPYPDWWLGDKVYHQVEINGQGIFMLQGNALDSLVFCHEDKMTWEESE